MRRLNILILTIAALAIFTFHATAQTTAPPPFGTWAPTANNEHLSVTPDWCKFDGNNGSSSVLIEGKCSWDNPTTVGAILTIMNVRAYQTAPVYFSIVWVNAKTIKVNGEPFNKQN